VCSGLSLSLSLSLSSLSSLSSQHPSGRAIVEGKSGDDGEVKERGSAFMTNRHACGAGAFFLTKYVHVGKRLYMCIIAIKCVVSFEHSVGHSFALSVGAASPRSLGILRGRN